MTEREKLLRRIKALLDKTVASGCPVDEALAALAKAKELIEEYGVSDAELASIGATAYSQRTSSSPPPQPPPRSPEPPPRSAHALGYGRAIVGTIALFLLLTALIIVSSHKYSATPAHVASQPTPVQTVLPAKNATAGDLSDFKTRQQTPLPSTAPAEPKKDTEPRGKLAAPDDEYVTDNDRCSIRGYNEVYAAGRLHCQRCPSDYEWDPQNQQCRLATSFRGESLPASEPVTTVSAIEQGLDGMLLKFSKPGGEQEYLRFMADTYTEYVTYYGNVLPRMYVLEDKRKFMAQWPDRSYSIRPGTLKVTCPSSGNYCNATGIMNFTVISDTKRISGSAEFKYGIKMGKDAVGAFITNEDGKVTERHYEFVSADGNRCPDGFEPILHHKAGQLYCRRPE